VIPIWDGKTENGMVVSSGAHLVFKDAVENILEAASQYIPQHLVPICLTSSHFYQKRGNAGLLWARIE